MEVFHYPGTVNLENGGSLNGITIAYETYGTLNAGKSNVVWVCHHLTASAAVADWWPGMVGEGMLLDPKQYFIVCPNILGSCYGTTGPLSADGPGGNRRYAGFPAVTIRDMVKAHILLREYLGLPRIALLVGGSMGGYQALEWAFMEQAAIEKLFLLATSATESAWGIATHTAQRLAIEADPTWKDAAEDAGAAGLKAARAIGMLAYRNYGIMVKNQTDPDPEKLDHYKAAAYVMYQGEKLVKRFHASCYWLLTKAMDSHHLARGRGGDTDAVLQQIRQPAFIISISSDALCPPVEQQHLAREMPGATLVEIDSGYGHDGFMVEAAKISRHFTDWLKEQV